MAANHELTKEKFQELDNFIDALPELKGELIKVLHRAQGIFGFLPREVQVHVARKLNVPTAKVFGVVSFYSFFTMEPKGDNDISICLGTACYVRGADKIVEAFRKEIGIGVGETTADGKFSITGLRCIGACRLAPVVTIGAKTYGRLTPDMVKGIVTEYR